MITNLAAVLDGAGLTVVEVPGWKIRARPGAFNPVGVLWHHTGSAGNGKTVAEGVLTKGRADLPGPLCQLSIDRQGVVYVIAAGRANHAGRANAVGSVTAGNGNALYLGIEFQHTGTEPWPTAQYDAGIKATAAILRHITRTSERTVAAHYETSQTGKWDPGDPAGIAFKGARVLDMTKVRAEVAARLKETTVPKTTVPKTTVSTATPPAKAPKKTSPTRVSRAHAALATALKHLDAAIDNGRPVKAQRAAIAAAKKSLPTR